MGRRVAGVVMSDPRQYRVEAEDFTRGNGSVVEHVVTARSRSAARYSVYLDVSDAWEMAFRKFLSLCRSVALTERATAYDYVREGYGVDVKVGQRVIGAGKPGVIGEPCGSNSRTNLVEVFFDDGSSGPVHPTEISFPASDDIIGPPEMTEKEQREGYGKLFEALTERDA